MLLPPLFVQNPDAFGANTGAQRLIVYTSIAFSLLVVFKTAVVFFWEYKEANFSFQAAESRTTVLHVASAKGDLQMVGQLLKRGYQPDIIGYHGQRPLHRAAEVTVSLVAPRTQRVMLAIRSLCSLLRPPPGSFRALSAVSLAV